MTRSGLQWVKEMNIIEMKKVEFFDFFLTSLIINDFLSFFLKKVWITGWGNTQSQLKPAILRKAQVPIVSPYLCSALVAGEVDSKTMLCAGLNLYINA